MFRVPACQLKKARPIPPSAIDDDDTITVVDDEKSLANMIADLRSASELALDSEVNEIGDTFQNSHRIIRRLLLNYFSVAVS